MNLIVLMQFFSLSVEVEAEAQQKKQ